MASPITNYKAPQSAVCAICIEEIPKDTSVVSHDITHLFHRACLQQWIDAPRNNHQKPTCPACRCFIGEIPNPAEVASGAAPEAIQGAAQERVHAAAAAAMPHMPFMSDLEIERAARDRIAEEVAFAQRHASPNASEEILMIRRTIEDNYPRGGHDALVARDEMMRSFGYLPQTDITFGVDYLYQKGYFQRAYLRRAQNRGMEYNTGAVIQAIFLLRTPEAQDLLRGDEAGQARYLEFIQRCSNAYDQNPRELVLEAYNNNWKNTVFELLKQNPDSNLRGELFSLAIDRNDDSFATWALDRGLNRDTCSLGLIKICSKPVIPEPQQALAERLWNLETRRFSLFAEPFVPDAHLGEALVQLINNSHYGMATKLFDKWRWKLSRAQRERAIVELASKDPTEQQTAIMDKLLSNGEITPAWRGQAAVHATRKGNLSLMIKLAKGHRLLEQYKNEAKAAAVGWAAWLIVQIYM